MIRSHVIAEYKLVNRNLIRYDGIQERCCGPVHPYHSTIQSNKQYDQREPGCECGCNIRHIHCRYCGRVLSWGDWDKPPIASFYINL